jgi:hypothetical protein
MSKVKILTLLAACACALPAMDAESSGATSREKRRARRKVQRKAEQKEKETASIANTYKDTPKLDPDTMGEAGKVDDRKVSDRRLDHNLAERVRELHKAEKTKLVKKELTKITEAAEEKRREEEEAERERRKRQHKRQKIDLSILFDW